MITNMLEHQSKKTTICELQQLSGFLNFLCRAVVPGHAFTRGLYHYIKNSKFKPHHHIRINQEMTLDLKMWSIFLHHHTALARPFIDFTGSACTNAEILSMYSDASGNFELGLGVICQSSWTYAKWNTDFCRKVNPSIKYLELFGVLTGVLLWIDRFHNKRVILHCDNMSMVEMINTSSSTYKNCMVLIQLLVLKGLIKNMRIFTRHVSGSANYFLNTLSNILPIH